MFWHFGSQASILFSTLHSLLEVSFAKDGVNKALSSALALLFGAQLFLPRYSFKPTVILVLGMRSGIRGYQSYKEGHTWEAVAHLTLGAVRVGAFGLEGISRSQDTENSPHRFLFAIGRSKETRDERARELKEQAKGERASAAEHVHQATKETLNGNFGNAVEHSAEAIRDFVHSRCDETLAKEVKTAPDCKWEAMEREGYADSRLYPWKE